MSITSEISSVGSEEKLQQTSSKLVSTTLNLVFTFKDIRIFYLIDEGTTKKREDR